MPRRKRAQHKRTNDDRCHDKKLVLMRKPPRYNLCFVDLDRRELFFEIEYWSRHRTRDVSHDGWFLRLIFLAT
jgi:hypothetical protein